MSPSFWQYHRTIEINITDNHHFVFVYILGKLDYSLCMCVDMFKQPVFRWFFFIYVVMKNPIRNGVAESIGK